MVAEIKQITSEQAEITRMERLFEAQKQTYQHYKKPSLEERLLTLDILRDLLLSHIDDMAKAVNQDFASRSRDETRFIEVMSLVEEIKHTRSHLAEWMKTSKRKVALQMQPSSAYVVYQPKGVVGIISPWNYPFYLALGPAIAALAAGNRVMIKVSEFTPVSGELLKKMLGKVFSEEQIAVVQGEAETAQAFTRLPFDHILFTGSTNVGRHVMRAAADNLTPVTLELGGKSPCIIGEDFEMRDAAERIAFGKCINAGQTCVSPDYLLCPKERVQEFIEAFTLQVSQMYPKMRDNPDLTSVINQRQYDRLQAYLADAREKGARIVEINPANEDFSGTIKMPFTLVLNVTDDMRIAQEEIFGPILIVHAYETVQQAVTFVNQRPRPLALYYLDWNKNNVNYVLDNTHSGGVCVNDTLTHVGIADIPFGGIGPSGMGNYHGYEGFLTFTHAKGVYEKGRINPAKNLFPPYGRTFHTLVDTLLLRKTKKN